jgi:hypothetical protein
VDINQALADQGLAPYGTLSGYVELDYQWPWDALCATVVNVDVAHSVIFNYGMQLASPTAQTTPPTMEASSQTLEGLWWKQEANVTGFVALTNPGSRAMNANLVTSDALGNPLSQNSVAVSPHGTKLVDLSSLPQTAGATGGVRVVYIGSPNDLLVSGGLRDDASGYSANIGFAPPPTAAAQTSAVSYAAVGLMTGAADPMLSFPTGTVFTPYAVVRNISSQPVSFAPNLWWMAGGVAKNATLPQVFLAPYHALNMDVMSLLAQAGLKNYNGSVNLVFDANANTPRGAVLLATGSVDQKNNYVFQVYPKAVKESIAKNLSYWSTANGDDTMVTLWNPADEAQDFLFTLFYPGGHYKYSFHLEPRATSMFNISEILHSASPDVDGNVIPAGVQEGSAELSGSQGEAQHILVSMDAGTYNVQKATCSTHCQTCQGAVNSWVTDNPFVVLYGGTHQLRFTVQNHSGTQFDDTAPAYWSSSNTSVATVSGGLVSGVAGGSLQAVSSDSGYPVYATQCFPQGVTMDCPFAEGVAAGSPGDTQVPTRLSIVTVTDSTPPEAACTTSAGNAGCGVARTFTYQVNDQNGNPIQMANMPVGDVICNTSTNQLKLQGYITSCGGMTGTCWGTPGPCGKFTDPSGRFPERLSLCAPLCKPKGTCTTAGQTIANQTWTVNGTQLSSDIKSISYQCNKILVNGK